MVFSTENYIILILNVGKKNMIMTQEGLILLILNENLQGKHGGHLDQGTLTLQEQVLKKFRL